MKKLIGMGECLIDFMPIDGRTLGFQAKAGGAPANVCACVSRLGGKGCYLGKLSTDVFSAYLLNNMQKYGVDTDYVAIDSRYQTALAFVTLDEKGDRRFDFYRKDSCDLMLNENDIKDDMFDKDDFLHFCSVGLVESDSKYAHKKAVMLARKKGCKISFDVNMRVRLWDSLKSLTDTIREFLPYADIVKMTDEELLTVSGISEEASAAKYILAIAENAQLLFVTKGENGCAVYDRHLNSIERDAVKARVVDTTGAGDCFIGSIIYCLLYKNIGLSINEIAEAVEFALRACAKVVESYGAMEAMPALAEIENV